MLWRRRQFEFRALPFCSRCLTGECQKCKDRLRKAEPTPLQVCMCCGEDRQFKYPKLPFCSRCASGTCPRCRSWVRRKILELDPKAINFNGRSPGPECRAVGAAAPSSPPARCGAISRIVRGDQRFRKRSGSCPQSPIGADGRLVRACSAVGTAARSSPPRRCGGTSLNARDGQRCRPEACSCSVRAGMGFCHEPSPQKRRVAKAGTRRGCF